METLLGTQKDELYIKACVPVGNGSMTNTSHGTSSGYSNYCSSNVTQANGYTKVRAARPSARGVLCVLSAPRDRAKAAVWTWH